METFKIYSDNKGFVMLDGALKNVELVKVVFAKYGDKLTSTTFFSTWDGGHSMQTNELSIYNSPSDFERGIEMPCKEFTYDEILTNRPDGFKGLQFGWIFLNGEPTQIDLTPNEVVYHYKSKKFSVPDHVTKSGNVYKSRSECLSFNTYRVMDDFGDFTEHIGTGKLLMLDDDQKQLLKNLEDAFKALRENEVGFFVTGDHIQVFNKRKIDSSYVNEKKIVEGYEEVDIFNNAFDCGFSFCDRNYPCGDELKLFVERKD